MRLSRWLVVLAAGICASGAFANEPRSLTFQDRVKAQEAIERVYYAHRIWPKENPQPKPPFEQMVPRAVIEAKVTDYLKKCNALDKFWQRPITPEQLQAEMDRMARGTKDAAMLKELFAALGNNPNLIAECLARPVLVDRLIDDWYAFDARFHEQPRKRAERALKGADPNNLRAWQEGEYSKVTYCPEIVHAGQEVGARVQFRTIPLDPEAFATGGAQAPRVGEMVLREEADAFCLVRTVTATDRAIVIERLVFPKKELGEWLESKNLPPAKGQPGGNASHTEFRCPTLQSREPECTDLWAPSSLTYPVPDPCYLHTAVWTGTEMIVWGGIGYLGYLNVGGRYSPSTDTWTPTSKGTYCPDGRAYHTAVWAGNEMIIWGGLNYDSSYQYLNTGGRYNPLTDTWTQTSTGSDCPARRYGHTAVWTGTEMIVWGGTLSTSDNTVNTGGRYTPLNDTWTPTSTGANCPVARTLHTSVWTGSVMVVWGGYRIGGFLNTGGQYNPSTDSWTPTSTGTNCPAARGYHSGVWTGSELVIWGGQVNNNLTGTGGRYNPATDLWTAMSTGGNCPSARENHTAIWTGNEVIEWGGVTSGSILSSGGRYSPSTDTWLPTSEGSGCPGARVAHTALWTGTEMIVWGGEDSAGYVNTGGRYNPLTDSWLPTSIAFGFPTVRYVPTTVWTGVEMVMWGGNDGNIPVNTGGRYNPSLDTWTSTSTGPNCPMGHDSLAAVWTGTEMVVWGGFDNNGATNTGGRYNPTTDAWNPTSTGTGCPIPRWIPTAVWTGSKMVVWGGRDYDADSGDFHALGSGGNYDPTADTWTPTSTDPNCPFARAEHTAVWTGEEMVIWGGAYSDSSGTFYSFNTGGRYNPSADSWISTSTESNCPSARVMHAAVWTGTEMLVWGGYGDYNYLNTGARYNPANDAWTTISAGLNCPSPRDGHAALWTGSEMLIWGGDSCDSDCTDYNTGGLYSPSTDTWRATSTGTNCPVPRTIPSAVWTGTAMIVWGGIPLTSSGGIYYPGFSIIGPTNVCQGISATLEVSPYPGSLPCQWFKDGVEIPGATSPTYIATVSGTYYAQIGVTGATCVTPEHVLLVLSDPTIPVAGAHQNTCPNTKVGLITAFFDSYQWKYNGAPITGARSSTYVVTLGGQYSVSVVDSNGCEGTSSGFDVSITFCPTSEVSPNGAIFPARLVKDHASPTGYYLYFQRITGALGYNLYAGNIGTWYSHAYSSGNLCFLPTTDLGTGEMRALIIPLPGNHYYLVAARDISAEGPSGFDSDGFEIPKSQSTCPP